MKIPPFWTHGQYTDPNQPAAEPWLAYGWSFESMEDAATHAQERARNLYHRHLNDEILQHGYGYLDGRPMREEIVQAVEVPAGATHEQALITRNRYGSLVLNTNCVLFVDVDVPETPSEGLLGKLSGWFGKRKKPEIDPRLATFNQIADWRDQHPQWPFRLYGTFAGYRLLFTGKQFAPCSQEVKTIFHELGADPLYAHLTEQQECFRARLSPKPWRCHISGPPHTYPFLTEQHAHRYRDWERLYHKRAEGYRTCDLIDGYSPEAQDSIIARIIEEHDFWSGVKTALPLA